MANAWHHALSSQKRYGGKVEDFLPIHLFLDSSKQYQADCRHRALYHHTGGIFLCEKIFGVTIQNSNGNIIPVAWIARRHLH